SLRGDRGQGPPRVVQPRLGPLGPEVAHVLDHHSLFSTEALRAVGGCYGGMRIGFDTLLMNILLMAGEVAGVEEVLYHRSVRATSLTGSQATGFGSPARKDAIQEVRR